MSEIEVCLDLSPEDRFYGNTMVSEYRRLLISRGEIDLSAKLDQHLLQRKTRRKNIRLQVQKDELEKLKKEQEANLKMSARAARGNTGRANLPRKLKDAKTSGPSPDLANITSNIIESAESATGYIQEDDCDNTELLEDIADQNNRMEPSEWEGLPESESTAVQVDSGDTEPLTEDDEVRDKLEVRKKWIRMWVAKVCRHLSVADRAFLPVSQSNAEFKARTSRKDLICIICALDPTCTVAQKAQKRTHADLDVHLKGSFHDRESQITRAVKMELTGSVICPGCGEEGFTKSTLITHLSEVHPTIMWMNEDESEWDD